MPTDKTISSDKLRTPAEMHLPEMRSSSYSVMEGGEYRDITIDDYYEGLNAISLSKEVPEDIVTSFETAKNVQLYSWNVYRFNTIAEMAAYATLEHALSLKIGEQRALKMRGLRAKFSYARQHKYFDAKNLPYYKILVNREKDLPEEFSGRLLTADEWLDGLVKSFPRLRNRLMHGSSRIVPFSGLTALQIIGDLINQLFETKD